jgi:hypothetical protein
MISWGSRSRRNRRRAQRRDQPQDVSEQVARDGNLGHLGGDAATVANDFCADFAELLRRLVSEQSWIGLGAASVRRKFPIL